MSKVLESRFHCVTGLDPAADSLTATAVTDVINATNAKAVHFIIHKGVGATGTSTVTVEACDNVTPSNTTAIPFIYQLCSATGTSDVMGAITKATTAGFTTAVGSGQIYMITVDTDQLAPSGRKYVRLKAVETTDSAQLAGIIVLIESQYPRAIHATAIA